jgi:hypothetical protein
MSDYLRKAAREARWEARRDKLRRPVCWVRHHRWVHKMDLMGGAICARCGAYKPPVLLIRDK